MIITLVVLKQVSEVINYATYRVDDAFARSDPLYIPCLQHGLHI